MDDLYDNFLYGSGVLPEHFMLEYLHNLDPEEKNENIQEFLKEHGDKKLQPVWVGNFQNNFLRSELVIEFVHLIFLLKRECHVMEQWAKRKPEPQLKPKLDPEMDIMIQDYVEKKLTEMEAKKN